MEPQPDRRQELSRHVAHVPLVEVDDDDSLLTDKDALAAWQDLRQNNSQIPDRIKLLVRQVEDEVVIQLDRLDRPEDDMPYYIVSKQELHSIIARAAIRGSAQVVVDIGSRVESAAQLEEILDVPFDLEEFGDHPEAI